MHPVNCIEVHWSQQLRASLIGQGNIRRDAARAPLAQGVPAISAATGRGLRVPPKHMQTQLAGWSLVIMAILWPSLSRPADCLHRKPPPQPTWRNPTRTNLCTARYGRQLQANLYRELLRSAEQLRTFDFVDCLVRPSRPKRLKDSLPGPCDAGDLLTNIH